MDWLIRWALGVLTLLSTTPSEPAYWRVVVERLDAVRAAAFESNNADMLRGVYGADSPLLPADQSVQDEYARRRLEIDGMRMRISQIKVLGHAPGRAQLAIVDQLGPTRVRTSGGPWRTLPADRPTRHVVRLRLEESGWRIISVQTQ